MPTEAIATAELPPISAPKPILRHRVRDEVREMILSGKLRPGERLVQLRLAKQFNVVQGVIRESLLELKGMGLVETIDHDGFFVAGLDPQEALDSLDIREVFDGLAARICCQKASRDDVRALRELNDQALKMRLEGWTEEAVMLDPRFRLHERIAEIAGHAMLNRLRRSLRVLIICPSPALDNPRQQHSEHSAIIDAIADNRPDDAEQLARTHVRMTKQRMER